MYPYSGPDPRDTNADPQHCCHIKHKYTLIEEILFFLGAQIC
jgi:hypothetical protein